MLRKCVYHINTFCYVHVSFTTKAQRRTMTPALQILYQLPSGYPLRDQDQDWTPRLYAHHVQTDDVSG